MCVCCRVEACFSVRKDANPPSRIQKLARFPENPEPNWGPKARAKRKYKYCLFTHKHHVLRKSVVIQTPYTDHYKVFFCRGPVEGDEAEIEGSKRSKIQDENIE